VTTTGTELPIVTVVVATYGRPDALRCALESVQRQSMTSWRVIVIGDADPSAGRAVASRADDRMRFVDLPTRQGEQSRPNSVGLALATTPLIALLNHDDLWLPDHLERATKALRRPGTDLYAGSSAFAHVRLTVGDGTTRPVFSERTPVERELADAFRAHFSVFEPASALVITRELAHRVGPWRPAIELHRTPAVDWLLRAWRAGASLHHDPEITVLKLSTQHRDEVEHLYDAGADDLSDLLGLLGSLGADSMRELVADDLRAVDERDVPPPRDPARPFGRGTHGRALARRLADPAAAERFLDTGEDLFDTLSVERGRDPGQTLRRLLAARTGESLAPAGDLAELVSHCRRELEAGDA
jgi:glycosyltransferase involved in cell wall biosynthesis